MSPCRSCSSGSSGSDDWTPQSDLSLAAKTPTTNWTRPKSVKSSKLPRVPEGEFDMPSSPLSSTDKTPKTPFGFQLVEDDDFFPISNIRMCVFGLWLCVSNKGGAVLAFDFQRNEREKPPQVWNGGGTR